MTEFTGAHTFFILKVFFLRSLLRGSLTSVSSPLVSLVCDAWGTAPGKPCSMRSTRPRTSSNPVNQPNKWWPHAKGTRGYYGNTIYCPWLAPEFVPFLRRKLTGTKSQVDVLLHEWVSRQDRSRNGLKSRSTGNEEQYWNTTKRTPDVIHTNVKGFFQQLTTPFVLPDQTIPSTKDTPGPSSRN